MELLFDQKLRIPALSDLRKNLGSRAVKTFLKLPLQFAGQLVKPLFRQTDRHPLLVKFPEILADLIQLGELFLKVVILDLSLLKFFPHMRILPPELL